MIRVGVLAHHFMTWAGGVDFLRTVLSSLLNAPEPLEIHVLLPVKGPRIAASNALRKGYRGAKALIGQPYVPVRKFDQQHINEVMQEFPDVITVHEIDQGERAIARIADTLSLEVLVPALKPFTKRFPVPWVGYIYDFQHRYFPELFSAEESARRNEAFGAMLSLAKSVIVNSKSVAADVEKFHPDSNARVVPLPFSAAPQKQWMESLTPTESYKVADKPYFIISNQFWKHKDHSTAFLALSRVLRKYPDINLVCTGPTTDSRNASHFASLQHEIVDLKIDSSVHILGMIPKIDQIFLLRNSIALIQPTLFEGGPGGGAVFDAVSIGVKCIVSDIGINRELDDANVVFFNAGDSESLEQEMIKTIENQRTRKWNKDALIQAGQTRRQRCGSALLAAINAAIN